MSNPIRVLHLEDDAVDSELFLMILKSESMECSVVSARTRRDFQAALSQEHFDLIVSDCSLPGFDGMTALSIACQMSPGTPFIFLSGSAHDGLAEQALRCGAFDFILKDDTPRLIRAVKAVIRLQEKEST